MADGDVRSGHDALVEFASPRGRRSLPRKLNLLYVGTLPPTEWIHHLRGENTHRLAALGCPARARDGPPRIPMWRCPGPQSRTPITHLMCRRNPRSASARPISRSSWPGSLRTGRTSASDAKRSLPTSPTSPGPTPYAVSAGFRAGPRSAFYRASNPSELAPKPLVASRGMQGSSPCPTSRGVGAHARFERRRRHPDRVRHGTDCASTDAPLLICHLRRCWHPTTRIRCGKVFERY